MSGPAKIYLYLVSVVGVFLFIWHSIDLQIKFPSIIYLIISALFIGILSYKEINIRSHKESGIAFDISEIGIIFLIPTFGKTGLVFCVLGVFLSGFLRDYMLVRENLRWKKIIFNGSTTSISYFVSSAIYSLIFKDNTSQFNVTNVIGTVFIGFFYIMVLTLSVFVMDYLTRNVSIGNIIKESYVQHLWLQCITIPIAALAAYHWFTEPWLLVPLASTVCLAYYAFTLIMKYYQLNHHLNELVAARTAELEQTLAQLRAHQAESAREVILAVHSMSEELGLMRQQAGELGVRGRLWPALVTLERLVHDLLLAGALKERQFRLYPQPEQMARLLAALLADLLRGRTAILLAVETAHPWALVEARHISRVLRNLLNNALQHGASQITVTLRDAGDMLEVAICDNGQGIDGEQLASIRERWSSGRPPNGYGLGLQAAAYLTARSGGWITIDSAGIGQGTTVRLAFPRPPLRATLEVGRQPAGALSRERGLPV